jgi:hypothetical protein
MSLPYPGEIVSGECLEVDEVEVKFLIKKYNRFGYLSNSSLKFLPSHIGEFFQLTIKAFDESGDIRLI